MKTPEFNLRTESLEKFLLLALAVVLISTVIQFGGVNNSAVIDDHDLLYHYDQRGCDANPGNCFKGVVFELYYRPVMTASFALGEKLHGTKFPIMFHFENLLLHAADVALALWMFRLLFRRNLPALLAGLLFGIHPLQVTVTTFIGGRTDSLALFFVFWFAIGLLMADKSRYEPIWLTVSLLGFTAAIFTKEQCMSFSLLVPFLATVRSGSPIRLKFWMLLYLLPVLGYIIAASLFIPKGSVIDPHWSSGLHIEMVGRSLWYFVKTFLWPTPQTLHQSTLGPWDTPQPIIAVLGYLTAALWVALLWRMRREREILLMMLWATITILPCINLIAIPSQFASCYRAVIPLTGMAGLVGALLTNYRSHRRSSESGKPTVRKEITLVPALIAGVICLASIVLTYVDIPMWKSDLVLTHAEYDADPNFTPALSGIANGLQQDGKYAESSVVYEQVMDKLFPGITTTSGRIARGKSPEMVRFIKSQAGLRYTPEIYINLVARGLGGTRHAQNQLVKAIESYRLALAFNPNDIEVVDALARSYLTIGQYSEAEQLLRPWMSRSPNTALIYRMGLVYYNERRWKEAHGYFVKAIEQGNAEKSWLTDEIKHMDMIVNMALEAPKNPDIKP